MITDRERFEALRKLTNKEDEAHRELIIKSANVGAKRRQYGEFIEYFEEWKKEKLREITTLEQEKEEKVQELKITNFRKIEEFFEVEEYMDKFLGYIELIGLKKVKCEIFDEFINFSKGQCKKAWDLENILKLRSKKRNIVP